jgi:hypothetical protein
MSNPNKELNDLFGTKNKKEQVERLKSLIQGIQQGGWSLTITVGGGRADFGMVGKPEPKQVLEVIGMVRDSIVAQVAQQEKDAMPPVDEPDPQPQMDENIPLDEPEEVYTR